MRARNIKPGFFTNDHISECGMAARLLFIGLWCMADREGRLEDRHKKIRNTVFPNDAGIDVEPLLCELADKRLITRYESDGVRCVFIPNFVKHQKPHHREAPSELPPPKAAPRHGLAAERHGAALESPDKPANQVASSALNPDLLNPDLLNDESPSSESVVGGKGIPNQEPKEPQTPAPLNLKGLDYPANFERFWAVYPHKLDRHKSEYAWRAISAHEGFDGDLIVDRLKAQVAAGMLKAAPGKIPLYAFNWLERRKWEDVIPDLPPDAAESPEAKTKRLLGIPP